MMRAYSELYLEDAQENLASMFDYACLCQGIGLAEFYEMFIQSSISERFAKGEPSLLAGMSGVELAWLIFDQAGIEHVKEYELPSSYRSQFYWTGWVLAYYQWSTCLSFRTINDCVSIEQIFGMYSPYHEMDVSQFCDTMDSLIIKVRPETNMARLRKNAGFSQSQLANAAGISVRSLQHYEQRQKDINKAQFQHVLAIARALSCDPLELYEPIPAEKYEYAVVDC